MRPKIGKPEFSMLAGVGATIVWWSVPVPEAIKPWVGFFGILAMALGGIGWVCIHYNWAEKLKKRHPIMSYLIAAIISALIGLVAWHFVAPNDTAHDEKETKQLDTPRSISERLESPPERQRLQNKYRWGYRIYGLDKWGGNESYTNRFKDEYDFDWDAVKITTDAGSNQFEVRYPAITLKHEKAGIGGGAVSGPIRLGEFGGANFGSVAVSVEILEITDRGIVYLVGLNEDHTIQRIKETQRKIEQANKIVTRFYALYNAAQYDEIWNEANPTLRAITEVDPESWTAGNGFYKHKRNRYPCPRNDVSIVPR